MTPEMACYRAHVAARAKRCVRAAGSVSTEAMLSAALFGDKPRAQGMRTARALDDEQLARPLVYARYGELLVCAPDADGPADEYVWPVFDNEIAAPARANVECIDARAVHIWVVACAADAADAIVRARARCVQSGEAWIAYLIASLALHPEVERAASPPKRARAPMRAIVHTDFDTGESHTTFTPAPIVVWDYTLLPMAISTHQTDPDEYEVHSALHIDYV